MEINDLDRSELMALSHSTSMREDGINLVANRHNPFMIDGEVDTDRVLEFLCQYNEFLNHAIKPYRPFIESNMKL